MGAMAGCGLVSSDIGSITFQLPSKSFSFDTASSGWKAPPAGFTGMGRGGGGRPTELLGIWPALVVRKLVDEHVRVTIEEVA